MGAEKVGKRRRLPTARRFKGPESYRTTTASASVRAFAFWWLLTFVLGMEFLLGTAFEWHRLIYHQGFTISTNLFGTTFYSLVGLHATHVTIGLLLILFVMILTVGGYVNERHVYRTEVLSWYWHFVDAVWVVVFLTVYVICR